jgi:hypothetical protein
MRICNLGAILSRLVDLGLSRGSTIKQNQMMYCNEYYEGLKTVPASGVYVAFKISNDARWKLHFRSIGGGW